ncbi:helix-turn-helix domain-containing protein, partial [Latilactobacillus curvatus]
MTEKRKELHLTQQQLADKLHVTRQTLSRWENNLSYPNLDT